MLPEFLVSCVRWFTVICVSATIGAIANLTLLFLAAFLFAGTDGDSWVRWYFGNDGVFFLAGTALATSLSVPFVKRLRFKLV